MPGAGSGTRLPGRSSQSNRGAKPIPYELRVSAIDLLSQWLIIDGRDVVRNGIRTRTESIENDMVSPSKRSRSYSRATQTSWRSTTKNIQTKRIASLRSVRSALESLSWFARSAETTSFA